MIERGENVEVKLLANKMNKVVPHYSFNHSKEYVKSDIHTNTIESFWVTIKRGIIRQFHWWLIRNTLTLILTSSATAKMPERLIIL